MHPYKAVMAKTDVSRPDIDHFRRLIHQTLLILASKEEHLISLRITSISMATSSNHGQQDELMK